jgi:hypothetical protein
MKLETRYCAYLRKVLNKKCHRLCIVVGVRVTYYSNRTLFSCAWMKTLLRWDTSVIAQKLVTRTFLKLIICCWSETVSQLNRSQYARGKLLLVTVWSVWIWKLVVVIIFSYNRVMKNQLDAQLILYIFRQPLHVSDVSRPIIRRYNRTCIAIGTYSF